MNPTDVLLRKLIDQYELVVQNQAVTHEKLSTLITSAERLFALGILILLVQIVILVVKVGTRRKMADIWEILFLVKGWAQSAKSNVTDANATLQTVRQAT